METDKSYLIVTKLGAALTRLRGSPVCGLVCLNVVGVHERGGGRFLESLDLGQRKRPDRTRRHLASMPWGLWHRVCLRLPRKHSIWNTTAKEVCSQLNQLGTRWIKIGTEPVWGEGCWLGLQEQLPGRRQQHHWIDRLQASYLMP